MNKLYNNTEEITSNLQNFFKNLDFKMNKQNFKKIIFVMKSIILGGAVTQENIVQNILRKLLSVIKTIKLT